MSLQKNKSKFHIDVFPTDYFGLGYDVLADNLDRLCKQPDHSLAYCIGRRKGVELLLTLDWAELQYITDVYIPSEVLDDDTHPKQDTLFADPVLGRIIRAEYHKNPLFFEELYHGNTTEALMALEKGIVDAISGAFDDLMSYLLSIKTDDECNEVPNE